MRANPQAPLTYAKTVAMTAQESHQFGRTLQLKIQGLYQDVCNYYLTLAHLYAHAGGKNYRTPAAQQYQRTAADEQRLLSTSNNLKQQIENIEKQIKFLQSGNLQRRTRRHA